MNALGKGLLAVTEWPRMRRAITSGRTGRRLSLRFVAGETLAEAFAVTRDLNSRGASVSLDHLGEHVTDAAEATRARDDYLAALAEIAATGVTANVSVKLTQLGLGFDRDLAAASLDTIARTAVDADTTVTVDMEESEHAESTIAAYEKAQVEHGNLGIALQAYLHRTPDDLDRLLPLGGHIRLCKGAYAEPPDVALQERSAVNGAFDELLGTLMATPGVMPAIATHDGDRISVARYTGTDRDAEWEMQMLYGVRNQLQQELIDEGIPLRIYVPYGDAWYPYLTRRLAERPANLAFFVRAAAGR